MHTEVWVELWCCLLQPQCYVYIWNILCRYVLRLKTCPHPAVCTVASGSATSCTRAQWFCCILAAHAHELREPVSLSGGEPAIFGYPGSCTRCADVGEMASSRTWMLQAIQSTVSDIDSVWDHNTLSIDRAKVRLITTCCWDGLHWNHHEKSCRLTRHVSSSVANEFRWGECLQGRSSFGFSLACWKEEKASHHDFNFFLSCSHYSYAPKYTRSATGKTVVVDSYNHHTNGVDIADQYSAY